MLRLRGGVLALALEGCRLLGDLPLELVALALELDERPRAQPIKLGAKLFDLVGEFARTASRT